MLLGAAVLTSWLPLLRHFRRRLVAWLQRRGHGWDVVSRVLKEVKL